MNGNGEIKSCRFFTTIPTTLSDTSGRYPHEGIGIEKREVI